MNHSLDNFALAVCPRPVLFELKLGLNHVLSLRGANVTVV